MKIKYTGAAKDYSGYGEAARHDIGALNSVGVQITTQLPSYTLEISDFGRLGTLANSLEGKEIGYDIKIIHTTPNVYKNYMENGKYHIGRAFWETDKVPLDFAVNLQLMDEIWTGSEFNKQAMINAGVTKPIFVIPEAIDEELKIEDIKPYIPTIENKQEFCFYSIFEWTERKNPSALLRAFWKEFENTEGVSLVIKTYIDNFTPDKKAEVNQMVKMIKKRLNLKRYAPVYLYKNLMDRHQIYRFHKTFDCFVSSHRGEGWGIPQMEALLVGKPIISTGCGGIHEYLEDKKDALLVPYKLVPLTGNNRNTQWYTQDQKWSQIDEKELSKAMRWVFENQSSAKKIGTEGRKTCINKFSLKTVGAIMRKRLEEIEETIIYPVGKREETK